MKLLNKFFDFILYTNVWIGIAALLLYLQSTFLFAEEIKPTKLAYLIACSTVWLYSLHRAVGISKVKDIEVGSRFYRIHNLKIPIYLLGGSALVMSIILLLQVDFRFIVAMSFPALISILYVLPVFRKKKRLRDLGIIKIFLVALTWAWLTVLIPWYESGNLFDWTVLVPFAERFCFIFAITLPFDIRDLKIDALTGVKTIPAIIGIKRSQRLSYGLILIATIFLAMQHFIGLINDGYLFGSLLFYVLCVAIINWIQNKTQDYYYTGLLDGTMILLPLMVWAGECVL